MLKASGLAAGKGAIVCLTQEEANRALDTLMGPNSTFGDAAAEVVIEEFMEGEEASLFVVTDGQHYRILPSAQDHKRIGEGDTSWAAGWETMSEAKAKPRHVPGWHAGDKGSTFVPFEYQQWAGPWVNGRPPEDA